LAVMLVPSPAPRRIHVAVTTADPVSRAGITSQLRGSPLVEVVDESRLDLEGRLDAVALVVSEGWDEEAARTIRGLRQRGMDRVVLLVSRLDDKGLLAAVEAGACGILRRQQATSANVIAAIRAAAAGEGTLPPDMLGRLLDQVGRLQRQILKPRGLTIGGLTEREIEVLKLLAEGHDTTEVGERLFLSDRTVKTIVHDVTSRLELRNRTHAVAHAIRLGLI
jgi:DNA-binding NarL/FixJ family response regulator